MSTVSATYEQITASATAAAKTTTGKNALGKDDFLRLFVTRLANQDPMSPMQDEQFIAQMAQFTQLEQLTNMNDNLQKALSADLVLSQTINNTMATSLIGRTVRVQANSVVLDDNGSATIAYELEKPAKDVTIEISNSDGSLVRALRVDGVSAGANNIAWDGLDANGSKVAPGQYNLKIVAEDADGNAITVHAFFNGTVDGVRYVDGAGMLTVGSVLIPLSDVLEIHS
ncbi:MAG: flagellar hook capping protein [candidate division Zixibacteria bacterium]|nr:flagellar hook capping protein [candidate division Zixibacteria bacterium]